MSKSIHSSVVKLARLFLVFLHVHVGHLDGLQIRDDPTHRRLVVMGVGHVEDAPHTAAAEELLFSIHNAVGHGTVRQAEVRKFGLVLVGLVVEDDIDLVNDLVAASGSNFVFDHLGIWSGARNCP